MTVRDMLDQFEIQGHLKIQRWNDETDDLEVFYNDIHENNLVFRKYKYLDMEIKYMFPSSTFDKRNIEVPQIVIEVE